MHRAVNFWSTEIIAASGFICLELHRVVKSKVCQFVYWLKEGHLMFGIHLFFLDDFLQTNSFILLARYKWTLKTTFTGEWVTEGHGANTQDEQRRRSFLESQCHPVVALCSVSFLTTIQKHFLTSVKCEDLHKIWILNISESNYTHKKKKKKSVDCFLKVRAPQKRRSIFEGQTSHRALTCMNVAVYLLWIWEGHILKRK